MTTAPAELAHYLQTADRLALAAGAELLALRCGGALDTKSKAQRRELVTQADRNAEQIVVGGLQAQFPTHAILAEEGVLTTAGQRSNAADLVWVIDPLDGTTNYVHGLPFFAVAIALVQRGEPVLGLVHAPALGQTYWATVGGGAVRRNHDGGRERLRVSATGELADALLATGFSYNRNEPGRDDNSARLAKVLPRCRDLRRLGSAELDLCLVAAGVYDGYWELYLQPYDVAAGAVILREAGGTVSDLQGGDDWLFGGQILASNGALHEALLAVVGGAAT